MQELRLAAVRSAAVVAQRHREPERIASHLGTKPHGADACDAPRAIEA
jgi:hypothetical protein